MEEKNKASLTDSRSSLNDDNMIRTMADDLGTSRDGEETKEEEIPMPDQPSDQEEEKESAEIKEEKIEEETAAEESEKDEEMGLSEEEIPSREEDFSAGKRGIDIAPKKKAPPSNLPLAGESYDRSFSTVSGISNESQAKKVPEDLSKKSSSGFKIFLLVVFAMVVAGAGAFFYWWNYIRTVPQPEAFHYECVDSACVKVDGKGDDQCLNDSDCGYIEPVRPSSLIPLDETTEVYVPEEQKGLFLDQLSLFVEQEKEADYLERILVRINNNAETGQETYASLAEIEQMLQIEIPETVRAILRETEIKGDRYTLFSYYQESLNQGRLGLILALEEKADAENILAGAEDELKNGFSSMWLADSVPTSSLASFSDNTYRGVSIRYLNFPDKYLTIDYAIIGNKLIIATSKESMYAAIDALTK